MAKLRLLSQEQIRRNMEAWGKKIDECSENGTYGGYRYMDGARQTVRHIGPEEHFGSANGEHFLTCRHCHLPYKRGWSQKDWKGYQDTLEMRFTV